MQPGIIEGVTGCMFCGKTEEVMRRLQRARIAGQKVQFLTPTLDTRRGVGRVVSNGGRRIEDYGLAPTPVHTVNPIAVSIERDTDVIGIDEVQFFNVKLPGKENEPDPFVYRIVEELKIQAEVMGRRVIWSGLDMNSRGEPFGPVPILLAVSQLITKLTAVCKCGSQYATRTLRLVPDTGEILVGAEESYAARCEACYFKEVQT